MASSEAFSLLSGSFWAYRVPIISGSPVRPAPGEHDRVGWYGSDVVNFSYRLASGALVTTWCAPATTLDHPSRLVP